MTLALVEWLAAESLACPKEALNVCRNQREIWLLALAHYL
jgi:hypothetical protein